jgi:hypothetical protein
LLSRLLPSEPLAELEGFVGAILEVGDRLLQVVQEVEDIAAAGDRGQGQILAGAQAGAEIGDDGLGGEAAVGQLQEPHAPGLGVAMLLLAQEITEGGCGVDAHEDRPADLKDLIMEADPDAVQVIPVVDLPGRRDGGVDDVMDGPQGERDVEKVGQQLDHAAVRTATDQDQRQDQLSEPGLGDRQVEEDLIGGPNRLEGVPKGESSGVGLVI